MTDQTRNGGDLPYGGTNEGRFMESLRRFMNEVPGLTEQQPREDLQRVIREYGGPNMPEKDPLQTLPPSEAQVLVIAQQNAAPELSDLPFFRAVAVIARARWSQELQQLFDAENYLIQKDLGVKPATEPQPEVLAVIAEARRTVDKYSVARTDTVQASPRTMTVAEHGPSRLPAIIEMFRRNW